MQKKFFSIILSLAFCIISTGGQAQAKRDSIKMLFHVMQQDTLMNRTFDVMLSSMRQQLQSQVSIMSNKFGTAATDSATLKNPMYQQLVDSSMQDLMAATKNAVQQLLATDMVDIYDKHYTQQQINDFLVFYRSPSGQAMVTAIPVIQKDVVDVMTKKYTPAIQQAYFNQVTKMLLPKNSNGKNPPMDEIEPPKVISHK